MSKKIKKQYIGVDFDGTIVEHDFPRIGAPVDGAIEVLRALRDVGHNIILYTMRSGKELQEAVEYLENNNIELFGVNENRTQKHWTQSPKVFCNAYIDDAAIGCPLILEGEKRPFVDWGKVHALLIGQDLL